MGAAPEPVERDSRGILDPGLLRERVRLTRYPPTVALSGVVDRFWVVRWDLPPGMSHSQQVLTHPGANLTVGSADARAGGAPGRIESRCNGVARGLTTRALAGQGWTVAAMTRPGGLGAFTHEPASAFTDRVVPMGRALTVDDDRLLREVEDADEAARVAVLARALERALDPGQVTVAAQVAGIAALAETDRSVRRLDDLCARSGLGPRSLQRLFLRYAGVSPTWVLRRYRLIDAAEAVRDGRHVVWADVAADLGYSDQAHLTRDFRAALGQTPAAYARSQHEPPYC